MPNTFEKALDLILTIQAIAREETRANVLFGFIARGVGSREHGSDAVQANCSSLGANFVLITLTEREGASSVNFVRK